MPVGQRGALTGCRSKPAHRAQVARIGAGSVWAGDRLQFKIDCIDTPTPGVTSTCRPPSMQMAACVQMGSARVVRFRFVA